MEGVLWHIHHNGEVHRFPDGIGAQRIGELLKHHAVVHLHRCGGLVIVVIKCGVIAKPLLGRGAIDTGPGKIRRIVQWLIRHHIQIHRDGVIEIHRRPQRNLLVVPGEVLPALGKRRRHRRGSRRHKCETIGNGIVDPDIIGSPRTGRRMRHHNAVINNISCLNNTLIC